MTIHATGNIFVDAFRAKFPRMRENGTLEGPGSFRAFASPRRNAIRKFGCRHRFRQTRHDNDGKQPTAIELATISSHKPQ